MTSIWRRPVDLLLVVVFITFTLISATIDYIQSVYGAVLREPPVASWWPPAPLLQVYLWWCESVDPLLGHNPVWYETMAWFSPCIFLPFYCVAIYALIMEKEWIRIPSLCWSWGLLLSMTVIVREQLYGEYPTKNITLFIMGYGPYILMPLVVIVRMIKSPLFKKADVKTE